MNKHNRATKSFLKKFRISKSFRKISEFLLFKFFSEIKVKKDNINFLVCKNNFQLRKILRDDWEKVMINLLELGNENTLFLDIGANIGVISCLLAKKIKLGIAFEPIPSSFLRCVKNININNFENIIPLQIAASNNCQFITCTNLKEALTNYPINLNSEEGVATAKRDGFVKTLSIKLDELLPYIFEISPSNLLIKIDVEGYEEFVLEGANQLLSLSLPIIICIEYSEESFLSISKKLSKFNFKRIIPPKGDDNKNIFFSNS